MSDNISTKKTIPLNVQLSEVEKTMLEQLKQDTGKGFGALLREAIILRYRMRFNNEPACASGIACLCPHMHQVQPKEKLSDADLMKQNAPADGEA